MRILGTTVGGVKLITNMKTFLGAIDISGMSATLVYALIVAVWLAALAFSIVVNHQEKATLIEEGQPA